MCGKAQTIGKKEDREKPLSSAHPRPHSSHTHKQFNHHRLENAEHGCHIVAYWNTVKGAQ